MERSDVLGIGLAASLMLGVGCQTLVWAEDQLTPPANTDGTTSTTSSTQDIAPDFGDQGPADEEVSTPPLDVPNEPEKVPEPREVSQQTINDLEGTSWTVKVSPDGTAQKGGEKPFDDTLIFSNGNVTMTACVKVGFSPSGYTASRTGEVWMFKTEQTSKKEGQTVWSASLTGNAIHGTLIWTKRDGRVLHYTFEGQKAESTTPIKPNAP